MIDQWEGFYAAYMTGAGGQGFGMFIFHDGKIIGADPLGVRFDGVFETEINGKLVGSMKVTVPANGTVVQGASSGPNGMTYDVQLKIDAPPTSDTIIRQDTPLGPVNVKLEKLRDIT